ncbi:hypothetical protein BaRGS_00034816, partial [Batillaria attramentaria]
GSGRARFGARRRRWEIRNKLTLVLDHRGIQNDLCRIVSINHTDSRPRLIRRLDPFVRPLTFGPKIDISPMWGFMESVIDGEAGEIPYRRKPVSEINKACPLIRRVALSGTVRCQPEMEETSPSEFIARAFSPVSCNQFLWNGNQSGTTLVWEVRGHSRVTGAPRSHEEVKGMELQVAVGRKMSRNHNPAEVGEERLMVVAAGKAVNSQLGELTV